MDTVTIFRNYENTEFYLYDHLSGIMTMLVNDGCMKGIYTRCDSGASCRAALPPVGAVKAILKSIKG